ncbi:UNVERIFIED_CONTAM: hypothetical protein PYX00_003428 [Menopon gallinae]|uniref:Saposin B-type domain-containing protein n=1 Tax=Menopon gallinae TaxID=328185 RepID=A0AAW2HZT0_9NEOP
MYGIAVLIAAIAGVSGFVYDVRDVRCGICQELVKEVRSAIRKVGPGRTIRNGSHRLDHEGNIRGEQVPLVRSESFLTDAMDRFCSSMEDYARGIDKRTGRLRLVKFFAPGGGMSPEMDEIEPISDSNMNRSLFMHCEDIVDQYDQELLTAFQSPEGDLDRVCTRLDLCVSQTREEL